MAGWDTGPSSRRKRPPVRWQDEKSLWAIRHDAIGGEIETTQLHRGGGLRPCYPDEDGHARAMAALAGRCADFRVAHVSFDYVFMSLVIEADPLPSVELRRSLVLAARRLHYECWRWRDRRLGELGANRYAQQHIQTTDQVCACIQVLLDGWRDHAKVMTVRDARRCVALYGSGKLEHWRMKPLPI